MSFLAAYITALLPGPQIVMRAATGDASGSANDAQAPTEDVNDPREALDLARARRDR